MCGLCIITQQISGRQTFINSLHYLPKLYISVVTRSQNSGPRRFLAFLCHVVFRGAWWFGFFSFFFKNGDSMKGCSNKTASIIIFIISATSFTIISQMIQTRRWTPAHPSRPGTVDPSLRRYHVMSIKLSPGYPPLEPGLPINGPISTARANSITSSLLSRTPEKSQSAVGAFCGFSLVGVIVEALPLSFLPACRLVNKRPESFVLSVGL